MGATVPPVGTTVFVVFDGTGGQIDSVWGEQAEAQARADKLNGPTPTETLAWGVVSTTYNC